MSKNWEDEAVDIEEEEIGMPSTGSPASGFIDQAVGSTGEVLADMATVAPQAMLLEHADELINLFSPETAQIYREAVAEARKRSPMATTLTELFTPDLLDALTLGANRYQKIPEIISKIQEMAKGQNVAKGVAGSVATDAASQHGEGGEYDLGRTGMSAVVGGGLRGAGSLFKNYPARRAGHVGSEPKAYVQKADNVAQAEDYMEEYMRELDSKGLFNQGKVEFDPTTLEWKGKQTAGDRLKGSFVPPSQKEIWDRVDKAKQSIANETKRLVESKASKGEERLVMAPPEASVRSDRELKDSGLVVYEDFDKSIVDMLDEMDFDSSSQASGMTDKVRYQLEKVFGKDLTKSANIVEIQELRKKIDGSIKRDKKGAARDTVKEQAFQKLSHILRDNVKDKMEGTEFEALNKAYGDLASMSEGLEKKVLEPSSKRFKAGLAAGSIPYAAASAVEMAGDKIGASVGQMSRNVQKTPLGSVLSRGVRKLTPAMSDEQEPIMSREPQSFNPMPIQERMDLNLPKELLKTKLPRNTEGLQSNSQVMKMKVAQDAEHLVLERMQKAGVDTSEVDKEEVEEAAAELYSNISMVLDENPDEVASMLPVWIQQFPQLFEKDRYGRIDGVVPNSRRPEVREEIRKNSEISNKERITQLDLLNRSGEYKG